MTKRHKQGVYAYIDANNLYQNAQNYFDWRLDYKKFYIFLTEKYKTQQVYLFIGHLPEYDWLYKKLERIGYTLVFKEITKDNTGKVKGNCDADMAHTITKDFYEKGILRKKPYKAVIITADGDFANTIVLAPCPPVAYFPSSKKYNPMSNLIRKLRVPIIYISKYQTRLKK